MPERAGGQAARHRHAAGELSTSKVGFCSPCCPVLQSVLLMCEIVMGRERKGRERKGTTKIKESPFSGRRVEKTRFFKNRVPEAPRAWEPPGSAQKN